MNDLRIGLDYLTGAEIRRIGASLRSDPSDTQPGFYIHAYRNEAYDYVVKYTRVADPVKVANIALSFDGALGCAGRAGPVDKVVASAQREHNAQRAHRRKRAEQQLAEAEAILNALDAEERG